MELSDHKSPVGRIVDESFDRNFTRTSTLCLILLPHRLSYAVYEEERRKFTVHHTIYLSAEQEREQFLQSVKTVIAREEILHLPFSGVLCALGSRPWVLIPESYAELDKHHALLHLQSGLSDHERIGQDRMVGYDAVLEYAVDVDLADYLNNTFANGSIVHQLHPLLLALNRERPDQGKICYVFVQREWFTAIVFDEGRLMFLNSYPVRSGADLLYFTTLFFQQLDLDRQQCPMILLGEIRAESSWFETIQPHFGKMAFGRRPRGFLYNRAIRDLPSHYFYNLFALPLCGS